MELLGDLGVYTRQNVVEEFDDRDVGAKPPPYRAEFESDDSSTDDQELFGHRGQFQRAGRGHDTFFVEIDAVQARRIGAGGDDDILRLQHLRLTVGVFHFDFAARGNTAGAVEGLNLVFLNR